MVAPDAIEAVLRVVNQRADLPQIQVLDLDQLRRYLLEVLVNDDGLAQKLFVLLIANVLSFDLLPAFDFIHRTDDSEEFVLLELDRLE